MEIFLNKKGMGSRSEFPMRRQSYKCHSQRDKLSWLIFHSTTALIVSVFMCFELYFEKSKSSMCGAI